MTQQTLEAGTLVGGRFEIVKLAGTGDFGHMYKARDTKVNRDIAIRVIPGSLIPGDAFIAQLRAQVKEASKLIHRNIRAVFGMGVEDDGSVYIAAEWIDGVNLRTLLDQRASQGKRFSFKGAYNIVGHICNAVSHAQGKMFHGTMSPRAILVTRSGRIKVSDWELSGIRRDHKIYPEEKRLEQPFWSPEVISGKSKGEINDELFSLGAIYYELISGQLPKRPLQAPSKLGFPAEVDQVIIRCMGGNRAQAFENPDDLKAALSEMVKVQAAAAMRASVDDDIGIDVEIDITSKPPSSPMPSAGGMMSAPDLPPPPTGTQSASSAGAQISSSFDMSEVLSRVGKSENAHWMVQKDKFDHGPFSDRELIQMIVAGDVVGKHPLMDMDTGVRKKLRAWPQFEEVLEIARVKKKERDEAEAIQKSDKAEKRSAMFFIVITISVVMVIGLGVAGFLLTRKTRETKEYSKEGILAALDSGEIQIRTGSKKVNKGKRRRGKRSKKSGGSGEFVPGMSYEEAMNLGVDLGSLKNSGGQKQLTPAEISSIMDRNVRKFLPCVAGGGVSRVDMNIAINGAGKVIGVSVSQGDKKLKKCVSSVVRRVKFPKSAAPRTATSWYFEMY